MRRRQRFPRTRNAIPVKPWCALIAPVKAPFLWPNNSDSISASGNSGRFSEMKFWAKLSAKQFSFHQKEQNRSARSRRPRLCPFRFRQRNDANKNNKEIFSAGTISFLFVTAKMALEAITGKVVFAHFHFGNLGTPIAVCRAGGILGAIIVWFLAKRSLSPTRLPCDES